MAESSRDQFLPVVLQPLQDPVSQLALLRAVLRNPLEAIPAAAYTNATAHRRFMLRNLIYVSDPELIRLMLVDQADSFVKADAMRRALMPALGEGLLTAEGSHWRWQRHAAAPIFRHERLLAFVPAMIAAAERTRDRWLSSQGGAGKGWVDVCREMMRTTFDIIVETMLSGAADLDQARTERCIADYLDSTPWAILTSLFGIPAWVPRPGKRQGLAAQKYLRDSLLGIVARRRSHMKAAGVSTEVHDPKIVDLIDLLLEARDPDTSRSMTDRELADNLLTFITAGHETTALALTWSFYLLATHPEAEARAIDEVERVTGGSSLRAEHIADLVYTRRLVQEAMRLYPPAPLIVRMTATEVRLGDLTLPAGMPAYVPVYAVHRHVALWREPKKFDPDRFLPDAIRGRHRYAYLPFGAGPRICIGASFAMLEAVAVLATLLQGIRLTLRPGAKPSPRLRITLRPDGGLPMHPEMRISKSVTP
jgi:cytochrome P450